MNLMLLTDNAWLSPHRLLKATEVVFFLILILLIADLCLSRYDNNNNVGEKASVDTELAVPQVKVLSSLKQPSSSLKLLFGQMESSVAKENLVEPLRETPLNLKLKGILLKKGSDNRIALIANEDKKEKIYRSGDEIEGAKIIRIDPGRVVLRRNGVTESLSLILDKLQRTNTDQSSNIAIEAEKESTQQQVYVPKSTLSTQLKNLPKLLKDAKTVPYLKNGQQLGYRVVQINKDSIFQDLGLKQDDILRSVNGLNVRNTKEVLIAYRKLRQAEAFQVDLLRDGNDFTINYSIQ